MKRGASIIKKASKERNWGSGDPMAPIKTNKERGVIHWLLSNLQGLAQLSLQENRKGRFLGLHNKRPGLENNNETL